MNRKKLSLTAGAIAKYTCTIVALASFLIPHHPVQAETAYPNTSLQIAQAQPKPLEPIKLKLTPQQVAQIRKIREQASGEMQGVLTDKQKQEIKSAIQAGKPPQQAYAGVNLSTQQKLRLRSIMISSQKNMESVLTPAQKKQVENYRKQVIQQQQVQQAPKK
jgi:Spy/CpxP family protein refolding chaperone